MFSNPKKNLNMGDKDKSVHAPPCHMGVHVSLQNSFCYSILFHVPKLAILYEYINEYIATLRSNLEISALLEILKSFKVKFYKNHWITWKCYWNLSVGNGGFLEGVLKVSGFWKEFGSCFKVVKTVPNQVYLLH